MNHDVLTENLADYLEGDLALDVRALVDAHLDGCDECAGEVRAMQQTIRLLRALPEPEVPPMIAANVMRRIRAGEAEPTFLERLQRSLGGVLEPSFVMPAAGVAVAALVIAVVQGRLPLGAEPKRASAPAEFAQTQPVQSAAEATGGGSRDAFDAAPRFAESPPNALAATDPTDGTDSGAAASPSELARTEEGAVPMEATPDTDANGMGVAGEDSIQLAATAVESALSGEPASAREVPFSAGARGSGTPFGDPVLAQGFASEVGGPAAARPSRRVGALGAALATVEPLGFAGSDSVGAPVRTRTVPGNEDPRDAWLARALEHPAKFAGFIAEQNLAEQELWVARLGERALARGLMGELIEALRGVGDERSTWLADDFAAQAKAAAAEEDAATDRDATDAGEATLDR